jgi:Bacterial Ig-like domain (group 3)/FG-GAP-like repeat/FG-GAP repeat
MLVDPGFQPPRKQRVISAATLPLVLFLLLAASAAQQPTQTSLTLSMNQAQAGQIVTLTATVNGGPPSLQGTVTFLNGNQVLGTIQLDEGPNTATLKMGFPPAVYSITARFNANKLFQSSPSGAQPLTVTGTEPTVTTLQATADGNDWDFTASVFGYGLAVPDPPTGTVSLTEVSTNMNLGNIGLVVPGMNTFLPQETLQVGKSPQGGIASGDFNGDGCPDLAVVNQGVLNPNENTVSILLGVLDPVHQQCTGMFQAQMAFPVDQAPDAIAVGDFNADGILDLAVACHNSNAIDVLFGKGDGTFKAAVKYPTNTAVAVAVGDFNGDGLPDLATAGITSGQAGVLTNNGDGTFTQQQTYPVGVQPTDIAVGDFDGDGNLDMAVSASGSNQVAVLLGNGDGTFQQPTQFYGNANNPQGIVTADFNHDGCLDLAYTNFNDNTVSVLLGNLNAGKCDGTFPQQQPDSPTDLNPLGITLADFNGDGILDLAVACAAGTTVDVLLGKGDGSFQPMVRYQVGRGPSDIAAADFLGDGVPDIAVTNVSDNTASVLLGGTATAGQIKNIFVGPPGQQQINAAYTPNINFYAGSQGSVVVAGQLIPTTTVVNSSQNPSQVNQPVTFTAVITFNGSGMPTGTVTFTSDADPIPECPNPVNLVDGQATCKTSTLPAGLHAIVAMYSGDANFAPSNGSLNQQVFPAAATTTTLMLSTNQATPGQPVTLTAQIAGPMGLPVQGTVTFLKGTQALGTVQSQPAGSAGSTATLTMGFPPGNYSLTAQFNPNFFYSASQSGAQPLTVTGTEPTITTVTATPDGNNYDFAASVFGYGLAALDPPTGTVSLTEVSTNMNLGHIGLAAPGMSSFLAGQGFLAGSEPVGIASGDFNGDGCPDLAVANSNDSTVTVALGHMTNGTCDGSFQVQAPAISVCQFPASLAVGDFNANGILDLAVGCTGAGAGVDVYFGDGAGGFQFNNNYPPNSAAAVAVGDFNNDGFPDLAVVDVSGNASVLLNQGNGTFAQQQTSPAGSGPSSITVGDFNNDGFLDMAVPDSSGNQVFVLLGNGDGSFQQAVAYGVGNMPHGIATGDFDGDGCLDLAVTNFDRNSNQPSTISVLLGNKVGGVCAGSFQAQQIYSVGVNPNGIAVADFDGDGCLDLAVANHNINDNTVGVLLGHVNNGKCDGTFPSQVTYFGGFSPVNIAVADFLGDGVPDIAVTDANTDQNGHNVSILLGGAVTAGQIKNVFVSPPGQQQINATYTPNTNFYFGSAAGILVQGQLIPTTTTLAVTANGQPIMSGAQEPSGTTIALNATVMPGTLGGLSASGTISFFDGNTLLASVPIQTNSDGNGFAGFATQVLSTGQHFLAAVYSGDNNFGGSESAIFQLTITAGGKLTPSITLTANPQTINQGNYVYFDAQLQSAGGVIPTGTVTFMDGSTPLATTNVDASGQATYSNNTLILGQHSDLTATYNGDSNFNPVTSGAVVVQVNTPFTLMGNNNSGTVSPGGMAQFTVAVDAAWQIPPQPLIYAAMSCSAPAGLTCTVQCPPTPPSPPLPSGETSTCILSQLPANGQYPGSGTTAMVTVNTSGLARLTSPLHRSGYQRTVAAVMGLSGFGLVGLVFLPLRLRRKAAGGVLFLVIVVLCFGTSCGTNFAPGISSPPVNNTFYISVTANLREQNPQASTGYNALGIQQFWYALLIK